MNHKASKVLVINDHGDVTGGSAQVAIVSACLLKTAGFDVEYFCATAPVDARLAAAGIPVTCLNQHDILSDPNRLRAATKGIWNNEAAQALSGKLQTLDPARTIVHVHGWTKALTASIFQACHAAGFKVVHTLHEFFTACPNGGFFDYQAKQICKRKALSLDCLSTNCDARSHGQKGWRVVRQFTTKHVAHIPARLTDVIYLSRLQRGVLAPYYPAGTRWHDIPNPIDIEKPEPATPCQNDPFVFVGRMVPEKGADVFVDAVLAAGVSARIVGDGPQMDMLKARAPGIDFTGWIPPDQVRKLLTKSRALVLPSRWYEGQPLVVQEALAHGVPVVVSDSNGATEVVKDGQNGFVFKSGDVADLADKLNRLKFNSTVEVMGQSAYAFYWSNPPTSQAHLRALMSLYEECLNRSQM
jgi:glycosyltransferase involved in cell wall biosynthesis